MDVYPASAEEKLGFDVLRKRLRNQVQSPLGAERLDGMQPARTLHWLEDELGRVAELQDAFRYAETTVPLNHIRDVRGVLKRAAPEDAYVDPEDLHEVRLVLVTLRRLKRYVADRQADYPQLAQAVSRITPLSDLEEHIKGIIDADGSVRDDASPELERLRRLIIRRQGELRDALDRELRKAGSQGYATAEQPTIRGGRMVIPIRAEAKRKVEGFIHDTSATGQTVYIEPTACLNLNNEVRELKSEEKREVERILRKATAHLRSRRDAMDTNMKALAQFDLLQAKARLANHLDAVVPHLNEDSTIEVVEGRNPVLQLHFEQARNQDGTSGPLEDAETREVVPLDFTLGDDFRTLVITGPNAGGKTVTMKTVGLFALMLAYGLPIPVAPHSKFALFDRLIVDIGDEQSIEEDLSTFSSHVANLRHMARSADEQTLVLIDEAGTGTDPEEGGALAQAVLERLTTSGARTIATTHHGTLKTYAHEAEHVENGSMEFDQETLRPTYHFQLGVPGSSYAFEIAQRMGLADDILTRARELAGEQKTAMEELIATFESRNQELERQLDAARREKEQAEKERERYEGKIGKVEKERDKIRQQALEEAERIVQGANARIEQTIREIKEAEAEKEATKQAREQFEQFRDDVEARRESVEEEVEAEDEPAEEGPDESPAAASTNGAAKKPTPKKAKGPIHKGDQVVIDGGSTKGEVQEVDDDEAVVVLGSMHMRVDLDRLTKVGGPREQQVTVSQTQGGGSSDIAALRASNRIDVRGQRVNEALAAVQQFVDEAIAANLDRVEILHGKGTGALRQAIQEELAQRPDVAGFGDAEWDAGGTGVTIVELG
jgi:DNA mismatch repair protein MutS2